MPKNKYVDLLVKALPSDISFEDIFRLAPEALWENEPEKAASMALAAHPLINWDAYLALYPDVRDANVDACQHFLKNGIYENRKLTSWHPLKEADAGNSPAATVIIANYNNAVYLEHSIESVINQTCQDIEIIIVDDASTDNSADIIKKYAQKDPRIKFIQNKENLGTFMARKTAILAATGKYLLFLDSDDSLKLAACEILIDAISKGHDIVEFAFKFIINSRNVESSTQKLENAFPGVPYKEYGRQELLEEMFEKRNLRWNLCGKIFLREIVAAAMRDLPDGAYTMAEDTLSMLAIARHARNLYKIPDKLYFYNYGGGISASGAVEKDFRKYFNLGGTTRVLGRFAAKYGLEINFEGVNALHCHASIWKWLQIVPDSQLAYYYQLLIEQYGFGAVISTFIKNFNNANLVKLAWKYRLLAADLPKKQKARQVGIYVNGADAANVARALEIAKAFIVNGLMAVLFIEGALPEGVNIDKDINVVNLSKYSDQEADYHIREMERRLRENPVDAMICMRKYDPALLWDIMLLHYCHTPVVLIADNLLSISFGPGARPDAKQIGEAVACCADAVICTTVESALYARIRGINAIYINAIYIDAADTKCQGADINDYMARLAQLPEFIKNFQQAMPWHNYRESDYVNIIKLSSSYALGKTQ